MPARGNVDVKKSRMLSAVDDERIRTIADVALPGEKIRGDGGVVVVNGDSAEYKLLVEIESDELRDQLENLLTDNGRHNVVVVEETLNESTRRVVAHVWMVPRHELLRVSVH